MLQPEAGELDNQGYQEWVAGRENRIAERKARRLGDTAIQRAIHVPQDPVKVLNKALQEVRQEQVRGAACILEQTNDFLVGLDEMLAAS